MLRVSDEGSDEARERLAELRSRPERAVSANDLMTLTKERFRADLHFPVAANARLLADYSALEFSFPVPDSLRLPKGCPIDITKLRTLSAEWALRHPGIKCEPWTYKWFYLELLDIECKLKPRLWARWQAIECGLPLLGVTHSLSGCSRGTRDLATKWWDDHFRPLCKSRVFTPPGRRPWLSHLELADECPDDDESIAPAPVKMSAFPVYLWPQDGMALAREMRYELLRTSIFFPVFAGELRNTAVQRLRDRFAIGLRKKGWGETSGRRAAIRARDAQLLNDFESGMSKYRIADKYVLSYRGVYRALARARRAVQQSVTRTDSM